MWQLQLHSHEQVNMWKDFFPPFFRSSESIYSHFKVTCVKYLRWELFSQQMEHSDTEKSQWEFSGSNLGRKNGFIWSQWRQLTHHSISDEKEVLLLHFHLHFLLICIYSYIKSDGVLLKTWETPQLFFLNDSIGRDGFDVIFLAFFKLTSDCFLTQCDIVHYIMAVQKWHHLHYRWPKSLICSMLNRLVLTPFYFLRKIRADNIQLVMSHYYSARRVTVRG